MADIDLSQFRKLYIDTALEYLQKLEDNAALLLKNADNTDAYNEIFIASHSLKSQSLIMGYSSLGASAFALEQTYRSLKDGNVHISRPVLDATITLIEGIKASLQQILNGRPEVNLSEKLTAFHSVTGAQK